MPIKDLSHIEIWFIGTILFMLRYMIIASLFFYVLYVWKKAKFSNLKIQKEFPEFSQIKREVIYSLLTLVIYGSSIWLFLYWIENGQTKLYNEIDEYGIIYFFTSIIFMVLLHDTYFYWTHRLIHHSKLFEYVHKVHHSFKSPTPWASFAFHPLEAIISLGIIPIIIFIIPYHHLALLLFVTFLTVYSVIIHLGFSVPRLNQLKYSNTPEAHDHHHLTSKSNYGLYFTFWDKIMGTYHVEQHLNT